MGEFPLIVSLALFGLLAGHAIRRLCPRLVGLRDRALPFAWPWLELAGAALLAVAAARFGSRPALLGATILILVLLAASAADYLVQLIPDTLTFGGAAAGLLLAPVAAGLSPGRDLHLLAQPFHPVLLAAWGLPPGWLGALALAAAGAMVGFCALEVIRRVFGWTAGLEVMGMGDSKLAMAIGAFLGPVGVALALMASFGLGVVHGGIFWWRTGKAHAPFGPALAAGALVVALAGRPLARGWLAAQDLLLTLSGPQLIVLYTVLLGVVVWMMVRLRRRAALYEELIEEDYRAVDERLADGGAEDAAP